ncbi:MAG: NAD-dependent epimerase/dehydratase family protein [Alphaproteobacteria bacterium]|nr:NAD-dependent epimerase/dehydratase family protein [Alphaproteobacteria bacterium]
MSGRHALVTGGGGYLGRHVVQQLLDRGDRVTILARGRYPEIEALGAGGVQADLCDPASLDGLLEGVDVVFHTAAKVPTWAPRAEFIRTNVDGTRHLLDACRAQGVGRFVYTSSPSAVHRGGDEEGVTEADCPYPEHHAAPYPESKALAEAMVLAENGPALATTALRPHIIYGPAEPHMLPRIMERQRAGKLKRIGDGTNRIAITYIDNAAISQLQAADRLAPGSANAGKAYFITDDAPVEIWPWIDAFLQGVGLSPVRGFVALSTAQKAAGFAEWLWSTFGLKGEPPMTKFAATQLATSHWYDLSAARSDFGYTPLVSGEEGFRRTVEWFAAQRG